MMSVKPVPSHGILDERVSKTQAGSALARRFLNRRMQMKKVLLLIAIALTGCQGAYGPDHLRRTSQFCVVLDESIGLSRCETTEAVCYTRVGALQCYPKPARAVPTQTPPAVPSLVPSPVKKSS